MVLPTKARYAPGEPIVLELDPAPHPRRLVISNLGDDLATVTVAAGAESIQIGPLPEGGYGVSLHPDELGTSPIASTAVEVLADPVTRMRYGFVASFAPGRDIDGVLRLFRRLHLTAGQFYDWAYRHANLVGAADEWADPLGQPVSMETVRALTEGLRQGGTLPLGYAAVYGVGKGEWPDWEHAALRAPDGSTHELGGFLSIVDPSDPDWLEHFRADLARAVAAGGFAGFHLDQYGYPRRAVRPDGRVVDVAAAFDTLIRAVRQELPEACLVFNNVNDFPVWVTTASPQDVTYTEVWEPHDTLADIAGVAIRSRTLAPNRPAVLAAYQSVYAHHPRPAADDATRLTMATLFSHGATQLLAGEAGNVLVDPYYVRNHPAEPGTIDLLARWYDLLVAAGDVLMPAEAADITRSVVGGLNDEIDVRGEGIAVTHEARPGAVWRRVVQTPAGTAVHLINLTDQAETGWDTPKAPITPVPGLRLRIRHTDPRPPRVVVADPDRGPHFEPVATAGPAAERGHLGTAAEGGHLGTAAEGGHLEASLPPLHAWQIVLIRHDAVRHNPEESR